MKLSKKIMVLSLSTCLTLSPLMVNANNDIEEPILISVENEVINIKEMADYIKFEGKISKINQDGKYFSILVENDLESGLTGMVLHISEDVLLLNDKTKDFTTKDTLKEGMSISSYYHKDTVMALSMPPQLSPDVILVEESEDLISVHVDKFNNELISSDNFLKINPSDEMIIVDEAGNKIEKKDLANKDLIVFYTISTKSIPAQTTPEKIIVMEKENIENDLDVEKSELKVLDKVNINEKEIELINSLYKNKDDVLMIPLRQISEILGYEVKWDNELRIAELIKGANWTLVKVGEDNYNFAKMIVKLGTAPEIKDSTTFVPIDFLEEILKVSFEMDEDGMINIVE